MSQCKWTLEMFNWIIQKNGRYKLYRAHRKFVVT
jgi:hypothetical protein